MSSLSNWATTTIGASSYLRGRIGWQGLRAAEFRDDGPYLVTGTDLVRGKINWETCYHVSEKRYAEAAYIQIRDGDVLVTKDGTIGKIALVENCPVKAVLNCGIFLLRCKDDSYNHSFIVQILQSQLFHKFLDDNLAGSTIQHLYQYIFESFEFPVPNPLKQTKIAEILSTVDQAIAQTEALIAKHKRIRTGLMQDLLTRGIDENGNLRSEETHEFKDSPLGRIPVEWGVKCLGFALRDAGGFLQTGPFGSQLHAHEYVHEGIPVIMPQDIILGEIHEERIARIPEKKAHELHRHRMQNNDIVFSRRGDLTRAAPIGENESGWICGTGCFLLRAPVTKMDSRWFGEVYRHHRVQLQVEANAVGSTMPSLNNTAMEQLLIAFPGLAEQREITRHRDAVDTVRNMLVNNLAKLRFLKAALMQDLLTGKVSVAPLLTDLS